MATLKKVMVLKPEQNMSLISLNSILDVYDNTVAGDIVFVYGNHNIGNNSIILKDGVNWHFVGKPKITSSNADGTFTDDGEKVITNWEGEVEIVNTLGLRDRINIVHSDTRLKGFYWELIGDFYIENGEQSAILSNVRKNTIGYQSYTGTIENQNYNWKIEFDNISIWPSSSNSNYLLTYNRFQVDDGIYVDANMTFQFGSGSSKDSLYCWLKNVSNGNNHNISDVLSIPFSLKIFPTSYNSLQ